MLQGPVGPFFAELARYLAVSGAEVTRVRFNGGDLLYGGGQHRISFFGAAQKWRDRLDSMLSNGNFSHILLFGSERPAHVIAREAAYRHGVQIISLEEGYIRPGYITVEAGGNNASSPLARRLPPSDYVPMLHSDDRTGFRGLPHMVRHAFAYYVARAVLGYGQQRALFHRPAPLAREAFYWSRNILRKLGGGNRNLSTIQDLLENADGRYFLVPLQVAADGNMGRAARGWTSEKLIAESIASFARSAPGDAQLVFKVHPMERGHSNLSVLIGRCAAGHEISQRVHVIDTGSLGLLARHCAGMITINSTSGFSAIHHGVPLLVIGDALFAHPALATCAMGKPDFDSFWQSRYVADRRLREAYKSWIRDNALMPGDFYAPSGIKVACASVLTYIEQLEADDQASSISMAESWT